MRQPTKPTTVLSVIFRWEGIYIEFTPYKVGEAYWNNYWNHQIHTAEKSYPMISGLFLPGGLDLRAAEQQLLYDMDRFSIGK